MAVIIMVATTILELRKLASGHITVHSVLFKVLTITSVGEIDKTAIMEATITSTRSSRMLTPAITPDTP